MRTSIAVIMTAGFIAAAAAMPTPADATNISQVRKLCAKNPDCKAVKNSGGSEFCIKTAESSCGKMVVCLPKGGCTVIGRQGGGGQKLGNILGGSKVQTDPVKPKTAPKETTGLGPGKTGDVKQAGANNQRGPRVVRDHRGEQPKWGAPDRPRHQPLGGSSGGHPNGPPSIVRDHRK